MDYLLNITNGSYTALNGDEGYIPCHLCSYTYTLVQYSSNYKPTQTRCSDNAYCYHN